MTPQGWIKDTLNRWPSGHHVAEGATHLAAALEEIARLRAEAGRVVVPELREMLEKIAKWEENTTSWGFPADSEDLQKAIASLDSVPSSRVLKDGEVAVGSSDLEALREMAEYGMLMKATMDDVSQAVGGNGPRRIALRTQATATESGKAREVEG